ncbi:hypothetical protein WA026_000120 [Henosepilachna vigintioctopunctata]|uniref:Uncharacterized protein n=1 Tax=Henosepilachna vigintioctopunctata TaxID=420089 RepID=A0AAW1V2V0_9CUCU
MNYYEQNKKALKNRGCYKKILKKSEIKRMIRERKKYVVPEHIETLDANKQEADRTLLITLDKLENKRLIAEEKIKDLAAQWKDLTTKELEFRGVVEYFNDSIIQIREKMGREKQKKINLQDNIKARCRAIDKIRKETTHFARIIGGLKIETENHLIYEDFLNKFAEQYEFKAIAEVLQRYTVLFNTREEVLLKLENTHSKSIKLKMEYTRFLHECDEEAVRLSDVLTQQTKKYDDIKRQVRYWESIVYGVIFHMQRLWREINTTRDALEQVVCLLLIRLHPNVPMEVTCNKEKLRNMLSTKTGNLSYVNKRLGDIEKLRIKVNNLIEENKRNVATIESEKFQWWKRFTKKSHDASSKSSKKSSQGQGTLSKEKLQAPKTYSRFPPISACTAKTLEEIRISLFGTKKWDKTKRKLAKADSFSEDSESISMKYSEAKIRSSLRTSVTGSRKSKGLTNWEFLKELGNMTDEELMKTMTYLGPIDGKMFKREDIPIKPYTCSSVTADPLAKMPIEKKINSRVDVLSRETSTDTRRN